MRVLVTGGAGYIGSHVCRALAEAGHAPVVIDNLELGTSANVKWGPLYVGDVRDLLMVTSVLKQEKIAAVIHLAGYSLVQESISQPLKYLHNNIVGTARTYQAALSCGVTRFVFSSSCTVYGSAAPLPMNETEPLNPQHPYAVSKAQAEAYLQARAGVDGLGVVALRYFNASGCGEDFDPKGMKTFHQRIIQRAVASAISAQCELEIYGGEYGTRDGSGVRDYIHVEDLARAHVLALGIAEKMGPGYDAFNLGAGRGVSVFEVIRDVENVLARPVKWHMGPMRTGESAELWASHEKFSRLTGWQPIQSEMKTIVASVVRRWFAGAERTPWALDRPANEIKLNL